MQVRALLDPCSEATLLREILVRKFGTNFKRKQLNITGVVGMPMDRARCSTKIDLYSRGTHDWISVEAYGLQHIGITTPSTTLTIASQILEGLTLADHKFANSAGIDLIIGANVYSRILLPGVKRIGSLLAQNTIFGWTITGSTCEKENRSIITAATVGLENEDESCLRGLLGLVQKFWAIEEIPRKPRVSDSDIKCENIYSNQHSRDESGQYIVPLPQRDDSKHMLGSSLATARLALNHQQRRMQRDDQFEREYISFMDEYLKLGHMRRLLPEEIQQNSQPTNYIPHHGIWQRGDNALKFRVVFNASRKTTSGYSLNDSLHSGPKLQSDLAAVVTRWRKHKVAFCTDIKMMYRQILVQPADTHLQRIVWSPSAEQPEEQFALQTVTYGVTSAPYLALRTLQQLCHDEGGPFPEATKSIQNELYIDDVLSGGENVADARHRRDQLIADVNELGLAWDPVQDQFRFSAPILGQDQDITKRKALSELARLFDPLGWLAPLIVVGKMNIQDLWRAKLQWDELIPPSMKARWTAFQETVKEVSTLTIPGWIDYEPQNRLELHLFVDASRRAMAAAVYSRTICSNQAISTRLVAAKTKLSPIKSLLLIGD